MNRSRVQKNFFPARIVVCLILISVLLISTLLLSLIGVQQNIAVIGAFAQQTEATELPLILNRSLSGDTQEALLEGGIAALQSAGYSTTYLRLFLRPYRWIFALILCCTCALLLCYAQSKRKALRRQLADLRQLCDFTNGSSELPPASHQFQETVAAVLQLKQDISRKEAIHEDDTTRIMRYMEDISHQLKTPLAVIQAACERTMLQHAQTKAAMEVCLLQINKAVQMIGELLQLGRFDCGKQTMKFETISAGNLMEPVVNDLDEMAQQKGLTIVTDVSDNPSLFCDAFWMQEVLGNLLKNCIEHSAEGKITVRCEADEQYTKIKIHDCGTGLSEGAQARLFERYSFGDRVSKEHAGLGMAIAMQVIQLHFGTITAQNCCDGGVQFEVLFPSLNAESVYQKHS